MARQLALTAQDAKAVRAAVSSSLPPGFALVDFGAQPPGYHYGPLWPDRKQSPRGWLLPIKRESDGLEITARVGCPHNISPHELRAFITQAVSATLAEFAAAPAGRGRKQRPAPRGPTLVAESARAAMEDQESFETPQAAPSDLDD